MKKILFYVASALVILGAIACGVYEIKYSHNTNTNSDVDTIEVVVDTIYNDTILVVDTLYCY